MRTVQKVVAYIVRDGRLVVFVHADDERLDQSGLQVPAGTVHPGELPEVAAVREATEETALGGLAVERYLGVAEYDARPCRDELHIRHFFWLSVGQREVEPEWYAEERGDGDTEPVRFRLYWLPLHQAHVVSAGHGALLGRLCDALASPAKGRRAG